MADRTAADVRKELEREYGTYVATEPIDVGNARAFNTGDPVPVSHVERGIVDVSQVAKVSTKAGREAVEEAAAAE